jgi:hypothetical protein
MQALKSAAIYPYKEICIDLTVESIRRSIAEYRSSLKCRWCGDATRCPDAMCSVECIASYVADQHDAKRCDWIEDGDCPVCNEFGNYYGPAGIAGEQLRPAKLAVVDAMAVVEEAAA